MIIHPQQVDSRAHSFSNQPSKSNCSFPNRQAGMASSVPSTMRAMVFHAYGEPSQVVQVVDSFPVPQVGPSELLIKVHSASVNPVDWKTIMGYLKPRFDLKPSSAQPATSGLDVSGVVVQVGDQVTAFKVGDEVYGMPPLSSGGSYAEYFALDQSLVALKPSTISFEEAGALPLVALTSYQALFEHAKLQQGERVLILGGSGGTGSVAIQLAHHAGAHVTTTCSGRNEEYVRSLGADEVVDYTKANYSEVLPPKSFDVVYACTDGELSDVIKVIKGDHHGRFVNVAVKSYAPAADAAPVDFSMNTFWVNPSGQQLEEIRKLVDDGKLRLAVDEAFPLDRIKDAFAKSMSNRTRGKLVVNAV